MYMHVKGQLTDVGAGDESVEVAEASRSAGVVVGSADLVGRAVAVVDSAVWGTHCVAMVIHCTLGGAPHSITGV